TFYLLVWSAPANREGQWHNSSFCRADLIRAWERREKTPVDAFSRPDVAQRANFVFPDSVPQNDDAKLIQFHPGRGRLRRDHHLISCLKERQTSHHDGLRGGAHHI